MNLSANMAQPGASMLPERRLVVTGLTLARGERVLAHNIDIQLGPGEVLLLRGPNGSGKSTLLSALAGIGQPKEGEIVFSGAGPDESKQADIHWLGHLSAVKPRLSVLENLDFWASINGRTGLAPEAALETTGLGGLGFLDAGVLSAGQTKRLALARLLISARPIWLLDEPIAALDASGEKLVGRLIEDHLARGGMVIAAIHHDLALTMAPRTLFLGAAP